MTSFETVVQRETSSASVTLWAVGRAYMPRLFGSEQSILQPVPDETERLRQALASVRRYHSDRGYENVDSGPSLGRVGDDVSLDGPFNTPARTGRRPRRS
jgi:hypothetical protein